MNDDLATMSDEAVARIILADFDKNGEQLADEANAAASLYLRGNHPVSYQDLVRVWLLGWKEGFASGVEATARVYGKAKG